MEEIGKLYPMSDSTLELREADMKYKDELIKAYGTACLLYTSRCV